MSWISDLLGSGVKDIIDGVADGVDRFVTTEEEKQEAEIKKKEAQYKLQKLLLDAEMKRAQMQLDDVQGARSMYKSDNKVQKVFVIYTLLGFTVFMIVQIWLAWQILQNGLAVSEFVIMTFSNFSGIFTALLFTQKDFFFGGSENATKQAEQVNKEQKEIGGHMST